MVPTQVMSAVPPPGWQALKGQLAQGAQDCSSGLGLDHVMGQGSRCGAGIFRSERKHAMNRNTGIRTGARAEQLSLGRPVCDVL